MKKVLLRDVKAAEREWGSAVSTWGTHNLITVRAAIRYQELKDAYEVQQAKNKEKIR